MKKYILLSLIVIFLTGGFFVVKLFSQVSFDDVKAFQKSIKLEEETKFREAIETLLPHYKTNQADYLFNLRLGWLYYNIEKYDSSIICYEAARKINPSAIDAVYGIRYPVAAKNDKDKLVALYEEILKADPNDYEANLRLGQIYIEKDLNKAKSYLLNVYKKFPSYYEPNLSLGYTYYYLGDYANAKILLRNALMLSSSGDETLETTLKSIR
ncbi:MAG: tetratricopeptide repeat protein [Ignavibacteriaceae bacterium]|nr:tetratricopeptide repeat protein [Ignavibacteriaceae bacterium]